MRIAFIAALVLFCNRIFSQELSVYTDTVNHFSIHVPKGWLPESSAEGTIKFSASRQKEADADLPKESYNISVFPLVNGNLDKAFEAMMRSSSVRRGYELIASGDTTVNNNKYKWLKEHHINSRTGEKMVFLNYLGYKKNKAYMISFISTADTFNKYESLFQEISSTFQL